MEGWNDLDAKKRDRGLTGARMENAGKRAGGRLEWSPLPSSSLSFLVPILFSIFSLSISFLPYFVFEASFQLLQLLVVFNLDNLQH